MFTSHRGTLARALLILFLSFAQLLLGCSSSGKKSLSKSEKAVMLVDIANGALVEGDPTGALANLMRAESEDPDLPEIYHSKALAFFAKHDLDNALKEAQKAVKMKPDSSPANNTLGKLLMDKGRYDEAVGPLTLAANDPLNREAYMSLTSLGVLHYKRGQHTKAREFFDRAVLAAPYVACVAFYYRGHLRLKESRIKEAISDYDHATKKICGGFGDAHLAIGIAYARNKQFELARRKFIEVQQRYPDSNLANEAMDRMKYLP